MNTSTQWAMGSSGSRVGRDIGRNTSVSYSAHKGPSTSTLADGSDDTFKSKKLYNNAKNIAMRGGRATSFKTSNAFEDTPLNNDEGVTIAKKGDYIVTYGGKDSNQLTILKKNAKTGKSDVIATADSSKDAKISWNSSNEPTLLTGKSALTGGKLVANGKGDILLRASKTDVQAGDETTVFNVSSSAGNFSGGDNVTYLGSYENSTFTESDGNIDFAGFFKDSTFSKLTGTNTYAGVFEGAEIDSAKSKGTFNGYFSESHITGYKEKIEASGLFLNGSIIEGSSQGDSYSGRFINREVDAGKGADTFGNATYTKGKEQHSHDTDFSETYEGIEADFIDSQINTGTGDTTFKGVMWGGNLDLDAGKNTINGVFAKASVTGGAGDDSISAEYSRSSTFTTGSGKNKINLETSVESDIIAEKVAENQIYLGKNNADSTASSWQTSQDFFLKERATIAGELQNNTIDIEQGQNQVSVENGESTVKAASGDFSNSPSENKAEDTSSLSKQNAESSAESTIQATATDNTSKKKALNKMANRYSQTSGSNPQEFQGTAAIITRSKKESIKVKEAERKDVADDFGGFTETVMIENRYGNLVGKRFKGVSI